MVSASPSRTAPRTRKAGCLTASVVLGGWLAVGPAAHADTIPEWNLITAETLQTAQAGTGLAHSRVYAMVHGAMFDAVNAVERRYHPYAADLEAAAGASPDAAATAARLVSAPSRRHCCATGQLATRRRRIRHSLARPR